MKDRKQSMVNFDSDRYKSMLKVEKLAYLEGEIQKNDDMEADTNFKLELLQARKTKLIAERTKQLS